MKTAMQDKTDAARDAGQPINRYKNPWWKSCNTSRPEYYENKAPKIGEHRGVEVFRLFRGSFDFVIGGCCITQRAGASKIAEVVDQILDGKTPVDTGVHRHLLSLGFSPISYEDYTAAWSRGEVA